MCFQQNFQHFKEPSIQYCCNPVYSVTRWNGFISNGLSLPPVVNFKKYTMTVN